MDSEEEIRRKKYQEEIVFKSKPSPLLIVKCAISKSVSFFDPTQNSFYTISEPIFAVMGAFQVQHISHVPGELGPITVRVTP